MYFVYYNDDAFKELAEAIHEALQEQNITSYLITKAQPDQAQDPNHLYIILGLNNEIPFLPKKYIAYQLEQSGNENQNHWFTHQYLKKLAGAIEIWDYSLKNIQNLKALAKEYNFPKTKYVPMRYQPILTRTRALPNHLSSDSKHDSQIDHRKHDVLFFGSKCPRRDQIIRELRNRNIKVHYSENSLWGEERDRLVSESKIVLNIHYYENPILETSRLTYLLANQAFVISEPSQDKLLDKHYSNMVIFADYKDIPQQCQNYLEHPEMITKFAKQAHQNFIKQKYDLPLETIRNFRNIDPPLLVKIQPTNQVLNGKEVADGGEERKGIIRDLFKKAETKITTEGETLILDKNLPEDQLPHVSFVTPTANRHWALTTIALRSFYQMIYPKNKMEWVILDDVHEDKNFYLPQDKRIRYYQCPPGTPIWEKRNKLVELANYNIIIHLDDDDYYLPQSAYAKVQLLNKYWGENIECVGTTTLGIYHILKNYSYLAQNVYISEASLAYNKKFWEDRHFQDKDLNMGEGYAFINQREEKVLDMPYSFNLIALTHDNNYTKSLRTHERNDHQKYDNFFNLWDRDTQLFFLELRSKLKRLSAK